MSDFAQFRLILAGLMGAMVFLIWPALLGWSFLVAAYWLVWGDEVQVAWGLWRFRRTQRGRLPGDAIL